MTAFAHDAAVPVRRVGPGSRLPGGLAFAVVSAASFGMSGPLARGLLDTGWSAGAVVMVRIGLAALVVTPFGLLALRRRWHLLRRNGGLIMVYGVLAVAGAQFCYFSAVAHMQVGPALLIEYTAPATVVVWLWLRHGQRPARVTVVGAGLAALGLLMVLDVLSGAPLETTGVLWALGAMVGATAYFVISADEGNGLPPLTLAAGGLMVGTAVLGVLGVTGVLPMDAASGQTAYAGQPFPWWAPVLVLGLVTAAISYTTGIAAGRRLGSRLASFVALLEVLAAIGFAWVLLDELPKAVQLLGGVLVLAGVVVVKVGEPSVGTAEPASEPAERAGPASSAHPSAILILSQGPASCPLRGESATRASPRCGRRSRPRRC